MVTRAACLLLCILVTVTMTTTRCLYSVAMTTVPSRGLERCTFIRYMASSSEWIYMYNEIHVKPLQRDKWNSMCRTTLHHWPYGLHYLPLGPIAYTYIHVLVCVCGMPGVHEHLLSALRRVTLLFPPPPHPPHPGHICVQELWPDGLSVLLY